jgi:hypothetical protein
VGTIDLNGCKTHVKLYCFECFENPKQDLSATHHALGSLIRERCPADDASTVVAVREARGPGCGRLGLALDARMASRAGTAAAHVSAIGGRDALQGGYVRDVYSSGNNGFR